jgi:hypothetical protein
MLYCSAFCSSEYEPPEPATVCVWVRVFVQFD